jgi:hypothetical protein
VAVYRAYLINSVLTWLKISEQYVPVSTGTGLAPSTTLAPSDTLAPKA